MNDAAHMPIRIPVLPVIVCAVVLVVGVLCSVMCSVLGTSPRPTFADDDHANAYASCTSCTRPDSASP